MFWASPGPFISNRPVRVVNLGRAWLGQDPNNRLLSIPTQTLLDRYKMTATGWAALVVGEHPHTTGAAHTHPTAAQMVAGWLGALPASDRQNLQAAAAAPTSEEIGDLGMLDGFFGGTIARPYCDPTQPVTPCGERNCARYPSLGGSAFYCPSIPEIPVKSYREVHGTTLFHINHTLRNGVPTFFGMTTSQPWGQIKPRVENALFILNVLNTYPFPSPLSATPIFWYFLARNELIQLINGPKLLDRDETRIWITMNILSHYEEAAAQTVHHFEEVADDAQDRARRNAIIKVAVGIVMSVVFPAAILTAVSAVQAVQSIQSMQQQRQAVDDMEEAAAAFEATDAAFAAEVRFATEYYKEMLAQAQGQATPGAPGSTTPGVPEEAPGAGGVPTELLVGGGIAAAAAAVALVFLGGR